MLNLDPPQALSQTGGRTTGRGGGGGGGGGPGRGFKGMNDIKWVTKPLFKNQNFFLENETAQKWTWVQQVDEGDKLVGSTPTINKARIWLTNMTHHIAYLWRHYIKPNTVGL